MKILTAILPLVFLMGCGDKDEDTAVEDTASQGEE